MPGVAWANAGSVQDVNENHVGHDWEALHTPRSQGDLCAPGSDYHHTGRPRLRARCIQAKA